MRDPSRFVRGAGIGGLLSAPEVVPITVTSAGHSIFTVRTTGDATWDPQLEGDTISAGLSGVAPSLSLQSHKHKLAGQRRRLDHDEGA